MTPAPGSPTGSGSSSAGAEAGHGSRLYVVDVSTGASRAATPEGVTVYHWRAISPDGRSALALRPDGTPTLYPLEGGEPRPLPGATRDDVPIRWAKDGRSVFVQRGQDVPLRVDTIDVATGARKLWKELPPLDPAGVDGRRADPAERGRPVLRVLLPPRARRADAGDRRALKRVFGVPG